MSSSIAFVLHHPLFPFTFLSKMLSVFITFSTVQSSPILINNSLFSLYQSIPLFITTTCQSFLCTFLFLFFMAHVLFPYITTLQTKHLANLFLISIGIFLAVNITCTISKALLTLHILLLISFIQIPFYVTILPKYIVHLLALQFSFQEYVNTSLTTHINLVFSIFILIPNSFFTLTVLSIINCRSL